MMFKKSKAKEIPWELEPSIYSVIITNEKIESVEDIELPDDDRVAISGKLLWAPGAADGLYTHHMNLRINKKLTRSVIKLLLAITKRNLLEDKISLYNLLKPEVVLTFLDLLLEDLPETDIDLDALHETALWLATQSADREPVKLGIALLGSLDTGEESEDLDIIRTLSLHNEFTLFGAVAISRRFSDPIPELWKMAKEVHGWGRIHAVEAICERKDLTMEIRDWLLRDGFRNSVMDEYLACTCATTGQLKQRMSESTPDKELLNATGQIIRALLEESSALPDIDDYPDSADVMQKFLNHIHNRELTDDGRDLLRNMQTFLTGGKQINQNKNTNRTPQKSSVEVQTKKANQKEQVLTSFPTSEPETPEVKWQRRYTRGWTRELRSELLELVKEMLSGN